MAVADMQPDIHIPQVLGGIKRPQLLTKLQKTSTQKLTLISAPPGYGKTVLAAQLANRFPEQTVWYTAESSHRDVAALFHAVVTVIKPHLLDIDAVLNTSRHRSTDLAQLVTDYLRNHTSRDFVLILDNVHVLYGAPNAENFLRTFIEHLPTNWHLVLVGQALPDGPMADVVEREAAILGAEDLRFTAGETRQLADSYGKQLTPIDLERLTSWLEGWPIGIALALHRGNHHQVRFQGNIGFYDFFKMLGAEALDAQPVDLRDFLLESSTLTTLSPECCGEILGLPNCAHWLDEIQQRNLFVVKVGDDLVYHRLFRDLLQYRFRSQQPEAFNQLHLKAAHWFESTNTLDESFDHYLAANRVEQAAALAEKFADFLFIQGFAETLLKWRTLLGSHRDLAPRLQYNCARIYSENYEYDQAKAELDGAEQRFQEGQDDASVIDVKLHRATIKIQSGEFRQAITEVAPILGVGKTLEHKRARAYRVLGCAHLHLGEVDMATFYLEKALAMYETREWDSAYTISNILQSLGTAYLKQGRITEARDSLYHVVELRRWLGGPTELATALNTLGHFHHVTGNYQQAVITFREGLKLISAIPDDRVRGMLLWRFGDMRRDQGHFEEAQRYYANALDLVSDHEPVISSGVWISSSILQRWQGDLLLAAHSAETALTIATTYEIATHQARATAARWAAFSQLGQAPEAFENLARVLEALHTQHERAKLVWVHALRVTAALDYDPPLADAEIERIWQLMDEGESIQPLIAEMAHTAHLETYISRKSNNGTQASLSQGLAVLRGEHPLTPPVEFPHITTGAQPKTVLSITTMGQEQIVRDGTIVPTSDWKSTISRRLFFYLLFNGPQSREHLCFVFWPDSDNTQVRNNFHSVLYRARRAVGIQVILHDGGQYFINPAITVWCDVFEFEQLIQQARSITASGTQVEPIWQQAAQLYHGDFLPNWEDQWISVRRRTLQDSYIEALLELGGCARQRQAPRESIAFFRQALDVDPYHEDAHRGIMRCFADLGEKQPIIAQFDALRQLLARNWNLEPSEQTQQLLARLLNNIRD